MGLRFEKHGNRRYAYWCTSRNVPGKDLPVSAKTYIGVLSEDGRTIIPKPVDVGSFDAPVLDGCFSVKDHGGTVLALEFMRRLGIVDGLTDAMGDDALAVIAAACFYAIHPAPSALPPAIDTLHLEGMFDGRIPTPKAALRVLEDMARVLEAYSDAVRTDEDCIVFPVGCPNRSAVTESTVSNPTVPTTVMVATNGGAPLAVGTIAGCADRVDACMLFEEVSSMYGGSKTFFVDRMMGEPISTFYRLVRNGKRAVALLDGDNGPSPTSFRKISRGSEEECVTGSEGHDLVATQASIDLISEGSRVRLVSTDGSDRCQVRARAIVVRDVDGSNENRKAMMSMLESRRRWLETWVCGPDDLWRWDRRFFRVTVDDGHAVVGLRRNVVRKIEDDACTTMFLTDSDGPDRCVGIMRTVSDLRKQTASMLPLDERGWVDRGVEWQVVPRIIAMRVRIAISRELASAGGVMTVDDAFSVASGYRVVTTGDRTLTSSYTSDVRRLFEMLHIDYDAIATRKSN